jgi:protein-S-isoprenylcysteine O-methyltransferase Ste14
VFTLKWWGVLAYLLFLSFVVFPFDISLRKNTRISLLGILDPRRVPNRLAWVLASGIIGSLGLLLHTVSFLLWSRPVGRLLIQSPSLDVLGLILLASGPVLNGIAIVQLSRCYLMTEEDPWLITSGAYGVCRNPVYVGMSLSLLGVFLLLPTGVYLFWYLLYLLGNQVRVQREEKFLRMRFGEQYGGYCQLVGRYWPRVRMRRRQRHSGV